jgi:Glycosyl hydrolase family 99
LSFLRPRSRREFIRACFRAGLALPAARLLPGLQALARADARGRPVFPDPRRGWHGDSSVAAALRAGTAGPLPALADPSPYPPKTAVPPLPLAGRFPDLRRRFVFEYYPWYGAEPFVHWDQWDRVPPDDIASNYVPRLGPYDSLSARVLEQHARWIAESGAGAVNLSWWGPGSPEDRAVPAVMDAMRDHGIKVTFHLEPYDDDRASRYAEDVLYLLREYGEKRRFDALLVLEDPGGAQGPLFKGFRCILPQAYTDCHGIRRIVRDYTPDEAWRRQTDSLRQTLRDDFRRLTLLADSLDFDRTSRAGFDGVAIYDNFVAPAEYAGYAAGASRAALVFSFNVNPGYDAIDPRRVDPQDCFEPSVFVPPTDGLDWTSPWDRERAASLSRDRIAESLQATLRAQADPALTNDQRGFLLVYINSFNEWHEGDAFEPMLNAAAIPTGQRVFGYHNPVRGDYRLAMLRDLLVEVVGNAEPARLIRRA